MARRAAHSLKSGAGQVGAAALASAAAEVERAASADGDLTEVIAVVRQRTADTAAALARFREPE
jgi:HPt (histidine-containing phosphotransfer) domain-containing protein